MTNNRRVQDNKNRRIHDMTQQYEHKNTIKIYY